MIDREIPKSYALECLRSLKETTKDYSGILALEVIRRFIQQDNVEEREVNSLEETPNGTDKYKHCNHHHEITDKHELVDFGDGEFVANKEAIPLLKALNEAGLRTRTHHLDEGEHAFMSILLDNATIEVKKINERDSTRTKYNDKYELLIQWNK